MKILVIFIDMLRMEQVFTPKEGWKNKDLENMLEEMGGTLFSSCYTPGPDSYRSLGCFWSSKYPRDNGCIRRSTKTYDFLKNPELTWMGHLKKAGYCFNSYVGNYRNSHIPMFPNAYDKEVDNLSTGMFLNEWLPSLDIKDNSFTFISFSDLHDYLYDNYVTRKSFKKGVRFVTEMIQQFVKMFPLDMFDETIIFSDHGFRFFFEENEYLLDERRSRIFLFWHHKNESTLRVDNTLRSIMDIYPTLLDLCSIAYDEDKIMGRNLFSTDGHEFLLFEEHAGYYSRFLEPICQWAVVDNKNQFVFINDKMEWCDRKGRPIHEKYRIKYNDSLEQYMTNYKELRYMIKCDEQYKINENKMELADFYTDGRKREKKKLSLLNRIKRKFITMAHRLG